MTANLRMGIIRDGCASPVTGVIDANTWVNERVREVDGACLPNQSATGSAHGVLGWICTDCKVPIAALQARLSMRWRLTKCRLRLQPVVRGTFVTARRRGTGTAPISRS